MTGDAIFGARDKKAEEMLRAVHVFPGVCAGVTVCAWEPVCQPRCFAYPLQQNCAQ